MLEISLDIGGWPIVLCDTAGLRTTDDPVEKEGLKRARQAASAADLVVIVIDATKMDNASSDRLQTSVEEFVREECLRLNVSLSTALFIFYPFLLNIFITRIFIKIFSR